MTAEYGDLIEVLRYHHLSGSKRQNQRNYKGARTAIISVEASVDAWLVYIDYSQTTVIPALAL